MTTTISIRLPDNLATALEAVANETERTKTFHIKKAVMYYLEEYADLQISLDRLHDKDDKVITADQMRKNLGL